MARKPAPLAETDVLALDFDGKAKLLDQITGELLRLRLEYATAAAKHAELRANIQVLQEIKSALQTALRAEGGI